MKEGNVSHERLPLWNWRLRKRHLEIEWDLTIVTRRRK